jgi:phosphoesterase RecJ-like protein
MTETIQQIIEVIKCNSSFLLTTHEGPDGDAIGSSLALASFLRNIGKDVTVHYRDPVPDLYSFLPGTNAVLPHIPERLYDVAVVLDIGERKRAGEEFCAFPGVTTTINIDHHLSCSNFGDINLIDSSAAATGILVHRIINSFGYSLDRDTALCIYVATITDTGSFRYSNANREAFTVAGEMIECGVNAWDVAEKLYENQPQRRLELLAKCLPTLEVFKDGQAASVTVTSDMYAECGADAELTDGFVNYPRSIRGVEVAIFFRQLEANLFKVGFRSKGKVNVAAFSAALGGGGHHNAAGCTVEGSLEEVKAAVYSIVEASL